MQTEGGQTGSRFAGEPGAWPADPRTRARVVTRALRPLAPEVHRVLVAQNARLAPSVARDAHLEALGRGAVAVVTGQQVGLFLGPLYTIYKAAAAVVVARVLAAETGAPVVPIFWLQTEDHDLVEIASCGVPGDAACETISVPVSADNRISIAHHTLPVEIAASLDQLADTLGEGSLAVAHLERLRRHYRAGVSWAGAFAGVLAELFAPEGLVMIDPRDRTLAEVAAPVHARALEQATPIAAAMIAHGAALNRAGLRTPVHVRPGAPLSFFHPEGALGPRVRLEPAAGGVLAETERSPGDRAKPEAPDQRSEGSAESDVRGDRMKYGLLAETERSPEDRAKPEAPDQRSEGSAESDVRGDRMKYGLLAEIGGGRMYEVGALLAALRDDPLRFSTSALLRPIFQDTLLPTAAYVGGPAEVAYFAQLAPLYQAFDRTPPLVVPRARFRITDARTRKLLARLGLSVRDAELSEAELLARLRPPGLDVTEISGRLLDPFIAAHGALAATLADAGPVVARALAKTRGSVERSVAKLASKVSRARLYADAERVAAVRRLRAMLAPDGAPQERRLGLAGLAARVGDRNVIERVLAAIDPFDATLQELAA
jgi:hypothetical protein